MLRRFKQSEQLLNIFCAALSLCRRITLTEPWNKEKQQPSDCQTASVPQMKSRFWTNHFMWFNCDALLPHNGRIVLGATVFGVKRRKQNDPRSPRAVHSPSGFRDSPCWPGFWCSRCQQDVGGFGVSGGGRWPGVRRVGGTVPSLYHSKHSLNQTASPAVQMIELN